MLQYTTRIAIALLMLSSAIGTQAQLVKPTVAVTGRIVDCQTQQPVTADVTIYDLHNNFVVKTRSNEVFDGKFYIPALKPGCKYKIEITQKGYFTLKYRIDIFNTKRYAEITRCFSLVPMQAGINLKLNCAPFDNGDKSIRYKTKLMKNIVKVLKENPDVYFKIVCFPDDNKCCEKNKKLTLKRAQCLEALFVKNGIEHERITYECKATTDPANPPPEAKYVNGKRYVGPSYLKITHINGRITNLKDSINNMKTHYRTIE